MEFRKMCSGHGKVVESHIVISLVSTRWLINKQTFETFYRTSKSLAKRNSVVFRVFSIFEVMESC